jgi:NAD(P)-dependent dehydrogenase (short-subunit alcohol dehydrogenase family)
VNNSSLFDLTGRKALVTGAGRGIGRVIAIALAEAGCDVSLLGTTKTNIEAVNSEIRQFGHKSIAIQTDVKIKEQVDKAFLQTAEQLGGLDICVSNAGIGMQKPAEEMKEEDWDKIIDTNLKGVFLCAQAAARLMIPQKHGSIINIASMSAITVNIPQKQAAYNTSKAGVAMLTQALAVEWAQHGIRVNSICPGYIMTDMLSKVTHLFPIWESLTPMGRIGNPEELSGAAIYLASEASSFTTGHNLVVDGGYTAR